VEAVKVVEVVVVVVTAAAAVVVGLIGETEHFSLPTHRMAAYFVYVYLSIDRFLYLYL